MINTDTASCSCYLVTTKQDMDKVVNVDNIYLKQKYDNMRNKKHVHMSIKNSHNVLMISCQTTKL